MMYRRMGFLFFSLGSSADGLLREMEVRVCCERNISRRNQGRLCSFKYTFYNHRFDITEIEV